MNTYYCYTDGACSNNGQKDAVGAWAFLIVDERGDLVYKEAQKSPVKTTNNRMELIGIIKCCQYCEEHLKDGTKYDFVVYTDSAYCHNCFKQGWYKDWEKNNWFTSKKTPVKNKELWEVLIPFFNSSRFIFQKVEGHGTNKWNNEVDRMAVEARMG